MTSQDLLDGVLVIEAYSDVKVFTRFVDFLVHLELLVLSVLRHHDLKRLVVTHLLLRYDLCVPLHSLVVLLKFLYFQFELCFLFQESIFD